MTKRCDSAQVTQPRESMTCGAATRSGGVAPWRLAVHAGGGAARPEPSGAEGLSGEGGGEGALAGDNLAERGSSQRRGLLRASKNRPPPPCRHGREPERGEAESEGGAADGVV
ncbi:uncharacterized protein LOC121107452 [Gallus gallus]|uniref:uncharacterized protein LOC121107452 n=1 Tax=Gallus gallus TaxID=9031 RepID=UPI001AE74704|nr:uncharacterized protein LOC121107452 [Gallus gallus]